MDKTKTPKPGTLLLIMDGLGSRPPNTGLMLGRHPNMDRMACEGACGLMLTLGKGIAPESEDAHLQIFGYNPDVYLKGRGPLEALGAGIKLLPGDIAFRTNLATVDKNLIVKDRRAGRIATKDAKKFERAVQKVKIPSVKIIYKQTVEHRGVLVLRDIRGKLLSKDITDSTDPRGIGMKVKHCRALSEDTNAIHTAGIINMFTKEVNKALDAHPLNKTRERKGLPKANMVLLRGAGMFHKAPSIKERFGLRAACVAGGALYKGISKYVGMDVVDAKGATGDKNTNIKSKVGTALKLLDSGRYDLIFLHIKATDSFSHDKDCNGKARFIEKIDRCLGPLVKGHGKGKGSTYNVIITGDHSTSCTEGRHTADPIPILIRGKPAEHASKGCKGYEECYCRDCCTFNEECCRKGKLGLVFGKDIMPMIMKMNTAKQQGR